MAFFPELAVQKWMKTEPYYHRQKTQLGSVDIGDAQIIHKSALWATPDVDFKDTIISTSNDSENGTRYRYTYNGRLIVSLVRSIEYRIIGYKLLSLTYKVLTTAQPSYLHNLISLQPPHSTHSSSVVTLSRPPTISSLKITDRSFRYASPRLWNQLPDSFRQPHQSCLDSPPHPLLNSSLSSSPLSSSITPRFYSRLKTYLFNKSFPP